MTLEARPNQPQNPEGISAQLQERFEELQKEIVARLEPRASTIYIISSDEENPQDGYNLSIDNNGIWTINLARMAPGETLNPKPDQPVNLLRLLKEYAYTEGLQSLQTEKDLPIIPTEYYQKLIKLRESVNSSVDRNPCPYAERLFRHMQNTLEKLST